MKDGLYDWLHRAWYQGSPGYLLLLPLTAIYAALVWLRSLLYRLGVLRRHRLPVPVIVVGNIVAGGAGKTPVTLFLANALRSRGYQPGIISRGYGRRDDSVLLAVTAESSADEVGDEPLLLARRTGCPVVVGRDRVAAGALAIELGATVIIADDGLQHHRLARDFEICVVDAGRGLGNGWLLPAGPLREPAARLCRVDAVLLNGSAEDARALPRWLAEGAAGFQLEANRVVRLDGGAEESFEYFQGRPVHAVAGIGNPERFFGLLEEQGVSLQRHPLPDHATPAMILSTLAVGGTTLMTEKDAVKLTPGAVPDSWFVPVDLVMDESRASELLNAIVARCMQRQDSAA